MRLIDADALINSGYPTIYHTEFGDAVIDVEYIKNAPTINKCENCDLMLKEKTKRYDK